MKRIDSKWSSKAAREIEMSKINTATTSTVPSSTTIKSTHSSGYGSERKAPALRLRTPRQIIHSTTVSPPSSGTRARATTSAQVSNLKQKAGPGTRKKRAKKPIPIMQRPVWKDVDINFDEVQGAAREMEQTPIDILSIGRSGFSCPPTCSSSGGPEMPGTRSPAAPRPQYETQTNARPAPRQPSPPRNVGRRAAGPRDTWGGFF